MRRAAALLLSALTAGGPAFAARSFPFLKSGQGPASLARAGGGVARTEGGVELAALNPAGLAGMSQAEAWSSYGAMSDVQVGQVGLGLPTLSRGTFAVQTFFLRHEPIDAYAIDDSRAGTIQPSNNVAAVSWARELRRGLSAGLGVKMFRESLGAAAADGQAVDAGLAWEVLSLPGLSLGAAVRNAGPGARFGRAKEKLPTSVAAGLEYSAFSERLRVSVDVEKEFGEEGTPVLAGGEYWFHDLLAFRAGYRAAKGRPGASAGAGFKLSSRTAMDYSYVPDEDFGGAHRVALSFRFGGGKAGALHREGLRMLRRENPAEAVLLLDKALSLDPGNAAIARALKEAVEKMKSASPD